MKISDTVSLKQVLEAHAEWYKDYCKGAASLSDERRANLSSANLSYANLRYANLSYANLSSANLSYANLSYANLSYANLSSANLSYANLSSADLRSADLSSADLSYANLSYANLSSADLRSADLSSADLSYANLRYAETMTGAILTDASLPTKIVVPNIDARILAAIEADGALDMLSWHTCETTHCRAGWAVALAGEGGRVLEDIYGPAAAGALIYAASRPGKPIPNFYATNDEAMASIKADAAEAEASSV